MPDRRRAAPDRRVPNKNKSRKRRSSYALMYIMTGVMAAVILVVLSLTVFFPITSVKIAGESEYSDEQITDVCGIKMNSNLFTSDMSMVQDNITRALPFIESVKVERCFPSTIKLTVEPASVYAQIESDGKYLLINSSGKCLRVDDKPVKDVAVVRGVAVEKQEEGKTVEFAENDGAGTLDTLKNLFAKLNEYELSKITVVNIGDVQNLQATYDNKIVLLFGSDANLDKKIPHAVATIKLREQSEETGTLNLSRIPNSKNQASFIPSQLTDEQIAKYE